MFGIFGHKKDKYPVHHEDHVIHSPGIFGNMNKYHYTISVVKKFPGGHSADCTIFNGTNLPKLAKVYAELVKQFGGYLDFKLDLDKNYDPDLGAFKTYQQIFGNDEAEFADSFDETIARLHKTFGENAD